MKTMPGMMNGPHVEKKEPELRIDARFDRMGDDSKYRAERKAEVAADHKRLAATIKGMTPEKAHAMVMASLEKELKHCKARVVEYDDGPSVSDAYDDMDEDDQADGKKDKKK